ncbi:MAG: HAD hydrolase-like protein, partial [Candidatus Marinimicrobia bacterium]|nr:HAD hydrolase-like protein [Candidatus Neomarinimicrobiota bacterium]
MSQLAKEFIADKQSIDMVILLDLDGTLTNTAHSKYKPYKDGLLDFNISEIPVFEGAVEFVKKLEEKNHYVFIVSDSHPKYVKKIAAEVFDIPFNDYPPFYPVIFLADKPNVEKTLKKLEDWSDEVFGPMISSDKDEFLMVGDSWLDIELGRRLNIRTVLTKFYKASEIEERDGIGQEWKPIKAGPTYYAKSFDDLYDIIENPIQNLLAIEAIFQGENSDKIVRFHFKRNHDKTFTAFRCLGRQEDGECDRFARADKYYQIDNIERSKEFISTLALATTNYIKRVEKYPEYDWKYISYVSDKKTTKPPNKMKEIFELVDTKYEKLKIFEWADNVEGSLRNQPNYKARKEFIKKYLKVIPNLDLNGKNIIVIDDQFTSSATAHEITFQMRNNGVKNILFIALF